MCRMNISEDRDNRKVIIDGNCIDGVILDMRCNECNNYLIYYDKYDCEFCPNCNEWISETCADINCDYCTNRLVKPLENNKEI